MLKQNKDFFFPVAVRRAEWMECVFFKKKEKSAKQQCNCAVIFVQFTAKLPNFVPRKKKSAPQLCTAQPCSGSPSLSPPCQHHASEQIKTKILDVLLSVESNWPLKSLTLTATFHGLKFKWFHLLFRFSPRCEYWWTPPSISRSEMRNLRVVRLCLEPLLFKRRQSLISLQSINLFFFLFIKVQSHPRTSVKCFAQPESQHPHDWTQMYSTKMKSALSIMSKTYIRINFNGVLQLKWPTFSL